MDELERLQRRRRGETVPPPLNINFRKRKIDSYETKPRSALFSMAAITTAAAGTVALRILAYS
jgi:hypothetical protein